MSEKATALPGEGRLSQKSQARSAFFAGMSGLFLLIVLAGFTPTLFLRAYFDVSDIPVYLIVHGAVLTAWFIWFFVQTSLVAAHRIDLHRRFGMIGAGIGVAVVAAGVMATFGFVPRMIGLGRDLEANMAQIAGVIWSNLGMALTFSLLLSFAIANRGRPEFHKRLMLLSSICILGPALGRLGRYPFLQVSETNMVNEGLYGIGGLLVMILTLVVYDIAETRRLHPVTMWGAPIVVAMPAVLGLLVANTEFGRALVRLLA